MIPVNDDFNPLSEEELLRKVRAEVRRYHSGEAQQDIERDIEQEQAEQAEAMRDEARRRLRRSRIFYQLFSGNILKNRSVTEHYQYLIAIAGAALVSIAVMFAALYADMKYSRLEREVQLLRERSIRLREQLYERSSHSAIVRELEKRNIKLQEPRKRKEVVED